MVTHVLSTDDVRVAVHDLGGSGPPLLILHATGFHGRCYTAIGEQLTDIRRVLAVDLRGHGDSDAPSVPVQWTGMVDDLVAVLGHEGITDPVDLVGHSMGGGTIVAAELRNPGTVRTAWLFEPIVWPADEWRDGNHMATVARKRRSEFSSLEEVLHRYAGRPPFDRVDHRMLRDYVHHGFLETDRGVTLKCTPEHEANVFDSVPLDVFPRLGEVEASITVAGSGDGQPPARVARRIAQDLPSGTFSEWDDNTHFGPLEDPARAVAEIRERIS